MRKILFILLLTIPFIGFGQITYKLENTKSNKDSTIRLLKSNSQPINGIVTGSNDKKIKNHKGWFKDGIMDSCKGYYTDGKLHHVVKSDGYNKSYYKNGQIKEEGNREFGEQQGLWKHYNKNGLLIEEGNWDYGEQQGLWKYYNKKGLLIEEGNWEFGKQQGLWKYYNKKGLLIEERNWEFGERID